VVLPDNAEVGLPGFLTCTPSKGVELALMGMFENDTDDFHKPDLVNGVSEDGRNITLY
jgi:hypothetical protein